MYRLIRFATPLKLLSEKYGNPIFVHTDTLLGSLQLSGCVLYNNNNKKNNLKILIRFNTDGLLILSQQL